jgi:hypothetical protein
MSETTTDRADVRTAGVIAAIAATAVAVVAVIALSAHGPISIAWAMAATLAAAGFTVALTLPRHRPVAAGLVLGGLLGAFLVPFVAMGIAIVAIARAF